MTGFAISSALHPLDVAPLNELRLLINEKKSALRAEVLRISEGP